MAEVYRERERERYYREDSPSDDERYRQTTVTRYKVPKDRDGGYERTTERLVEVDDGGRSHVSSRVGPRDSGDRLGVGGRDRGYPERPRSAFEPGTQERYYERDVERDVYRGGDAGRDDRSKVSAYSGYDRERDWDKRGRDDEIRVERRSLERFDDSHGHEVERIRKETEYYAPQESKAPIVIRQRTEPQKIIFQEAPPAAPLVLTRAARDREAEGDRQLSRRERDDEYYYRHERREVGPYRGDPRDDDRYAMARYDRDRSRHGRREEDDDYYYHRKKVVRRESSSSDEGHKRELAGGALAGAGITALLSSRRDGDGDLPANRGKKVLAGAALGALGTEALKRARSAYGDRYSDRRGSPDDHSRLKKGLGIAAVALAAAGAAQYYKAGKVEKEESARGRSRSTRHRSYADSRSRSRGYHDDRLSRSRSRTPSRSKSRRRSLSRAATAVLGTAAAAGIVKKIRDRSKSKARSKSRGGRSRSRSKSRLRRLAEIGGVAATAGVASKMWKNHREKKAEERSRSRGRQYSTSPDSRYDDDYRSGGRSRGRGGARDYSRGPSRSRSRSRSLAKIQGREARDADRDLGLVEYGDTPLPPSGRDYEDEAAARRRRRRRARERGGSSSGSRSPVEVADRKRSRSKLRDMAAAGAAAIGIKELAKGKNDDRDRDRDRDDDDRRSREREARERERIRRREADRSRSRSGRMHDDDLHDDSYFDGRPSRGPAGSPPMASGGAYYPPYPGTPGPGSAAGPTGTAPGAVPYANFPNPSHPNVNDYQPYVPQDYMGYPPPPPPGPPPGPAHGGPPRPAAGAPGPPPPSVPYVSETNHRNHGRVDDRADEALNRMKSQTETDMPSVNEDGQTTKTTKRRNKSSNLQVPASDTGLRSEPSGGSGKSVVFVPLSPKSSQTMNRHLRGQIEVVEGGSSSDGEDDAKKRKRDKVDTGRPHLRRRSSSDPAVASTSTSTVPSSRPNRSRSLSDRDDSVENLPERFDSEGELLDRSFSPTQQRSGWSSGNGWTTRQGEFVRKKQRESGWDVSGSWSVGGTDGVAVEHLARKVTEVLDKGGKGGFVGLLGVLGEVVGGSDGSLGPGGQWRR